MNPSIVLSLAMLVLALLGILWRFSSLLSKLETAIEGLTSQLQHSEKEHEELEDRVTEIEDKFAAKLKEVEKDFAAKFKEFDDDFNTLLTSHTVTSAVNAREMASLKSRRSVRPTEHQYIDTDAVKKRRIRK